MTESNPTNLKSRAGRWVFIDEVSDAKSNGKSLRLCSHQATVILDIDNPALIETSKQPKHHPEFFFDDTLVAIQIEDALFNVHKYQLAKSEIFSDMFKVPKPEGNEPVEGSSPQHPIKLEGVTASDFAVLLRVLYASRFSSSGPAPEASLLIPAFRLANMFEFTELSTSLLTFAEQNLDDVDKIVFAREFDIKEWLVLAHIRLCKRKTVLTTDKASKLGAQSVLIICHMRAQHRSRGNTAIINHLYCQNCTGWNYGGRASFTCQQCQNNTNSYSLCYSGPGKIGQTTNIDEAALEADVKKWVEHGYAKKSGTTSRAGAVLYVGKSDDSPDEASSTESPETLVPHPQFFLDNTLVAIQIEKTLFNVHKYQLIKSQVFTDMFNAGKSDDDELEPEPGSSPEHPIVVKGVAASDFAALLQVLYESHFSRNQHVPESQLIIPSFRLANLLTFSELRTYLLPLAEKNLCDVDKIVFAREFGIKEWLSPAHVRLCQREKPLSTEEARKLGVDSVLILWRMREQHRSSPLQTGQHYCNSCAGMSQAAYTSYTCAGCNTTASLRQDGPGRVAKNPITFDGTLVTAGVNKWVENDCIVED
ncbi:unnamed protein product [Rhizoctonia solani]|uniref:BTB domain-containing protein n=1 Tax=Rhizoctonia solani TaxID=456999 RepID=A0A8H2Y1R8_9AGAM|nr:unnamed protein product [Rhizoctonia solani]